MRTGHTILIQWYHTRRFASPEGADTFLLLKMTVMISNANRLKPSEMKGDDEGPSLTTKVGGTVVWWYYPTIYPDKMQVFSPSLSEKTRTLFERGYIGGRTKTNLRTGVWWVWYIRHHGRVLPVTYSYISCIIT
jgi:hypothetical protein